MIIGSNRKKMLPTSCTGQDTEKPGLALRMTMISWLSQMTYIDVWSWTYTFVILFLLGFISFIPGAFISRENLANFEIPTNDTENKKPREHIY